MFPTIIEIGPVPIHSYGLMMATAFVVGMFLLRRQASKEGINPDIIGDGAFWTLLLGLIGSRILHIIMFPDHYQWSNPLGWFAIWQGGLVFQGALPVGALFIYYWARKHKLSFFFLLDFAVPVVALGHGIGRIGCFLNGCCYGGPTDSFLGVRFPRVPSDLTQTPTGSPVYIDHLRHNLVSADDLWSMPIHATQLYAVTALFTISITLFLLRKHWRPFDGSIISVYFVLYGIFRFFNEFVRADDNPTHVAGLTDQQVISILLVVLGVVIFVVRRRIGARTDPGTDKKEAK